MSGWSCPPSVFTQHGVRFVHNLTDRTQWTTTLRNWAPFFFAQEQAYRRMGRFLVEDPWGFRRYQMAISAVAERRQYLLADGNGNQYPTFPGSGWFGKGVAQAMGLHGLLVGTVPPSANSAARFHRPPLCSRCPTALLLTSGRSEPSGRKASLPCSST